MKKQFKIKCKIPTSLVNLAESRFKRKEPKENLFKMYSMIEYHYNLELKRNRKRSKPKFDSLIYVPLSSKYFEQVICKRYYIYKKILVDQGYIAPKLKFTWKPGTPLFEDPTSETYVVNKYGKSYKILYKDDDSYVKMELTFEINHSLIAQKNINFLKSIGIKHPSIKYDKYGFRLYHNLTTTYKEIENPENYIMYDIKSSVPKFLAILMKKEGVKDDPYLDLLKGDFYINLAKLMDYSGDDKEVRKKAKQLFMYLSNGSRKVDPEIQQKLKDKLTRFEIMTKRKELGRDLIRAESTFMSMVVIPSLEIDCVMTIFDGIVINKKDESVADEFFDNLKVLCHQIEFKKGPIPKSKKKEVSHAI